MTSRPRWRVRLTAAAEADVRDIVLWTAKRFGAAQARAYADTLSRAIRSLAEGPAIMALHVARGGRKGRHLVVYRVGAPAKPPVMDVLRVLHDAMDLPRRIDEAKDEDPNHA